MGSSRHFVVLSFVGLSAVSGCGNLLGLGGYSVADEDAENGGAGTGNSGGNVAGGLGGEGGALGGKSGAEGGRNTAGGSVTGAAGSGGELIAEAGTGGVPDASAGAAGEGGGPDATACSTPADCNDSNECTVDSCSSAVCVFAAVAAGSACATGVCNGAAVAPKCVACADTASGSVQDAGCTSAKPVCDPSGTPTCYACNTNSDCVSDGVSCTIETCTNHVCSHVPTDSQCAPSGDQCLPNKCDAVANCKQVDISSLKPIITTATDGGNGGFEAVTAAPPPNDTEVTANGWSETGTYFTIYQCGSGGCDGANGTTFPQTPISAGGNSIAWTGIAGVTELYRPISLPSGTTKVQLLVDINFQTKSTAATNHDYFEVRLLDANFVQVGTPLIALSNANAQTGTAHAWTKDGINVTRDVSSLAGKSAHLMFWSTVDATLRTDFFFDNVRLVATVCQ